MKTKQQRKHEAREEYKKIIIEALRECEKITKPAFKKYEKKLKEIDKE